MIDRHFRETEEFFDDGSHIIYVNGAYKGDDAVGNKAEQSVGIYKEFDGKYEAGSRAGYEYS